MKTEKQKNRKTTKRVKIISAKKHTAHRYAVPRSSIKAAGILKDKRETSSIRLLGHSPSTIKKALDQTAGLWKGRKLDALKYQREIRQQYSTVLKRNV